MARKTKRAQFMPQIKVSFGEDAFDTTMAMGLASEFYLFSNSDRMPGVSNRVT